MGATEADERFMRIALEEARRAKPSPNPRVGGVLVRDGEVIATGFHAVAGGPHAEVDAITNATSTEGATLYVTLEPCNHRGRTGPCTEAILSAGITRVVVGVRDPADHGPGGIERLTSEGIDVEVGVLEDEARELIADFAKHFAEGVPFVTLKVAITLDGKLASRTGDSKWITGPEARTETHRMRADTDAILVGVGTVLADDPALTVRHVEGADPVRVVLDADLRTPENASVLDPEGRSSAPTWIFHAEDVDASISSLSRKKGVELVGVPRGDRGLELDAVLRALGRKDIVRLMVEGGAQVHGSFVDARAADRAAIFVAPRIMGDPEAISFALGGPVDRIELAHRLVHTAVRPFGPDWLITGTFERTK